MPERDLITFLESLKSRPCLTLAILFLATLLINLAFAAVKGWPLPSLHDEYSYLLAADTFSQGRLSNPSHPFAAHFETFHVLQEPTYASKYPPLPGAFLALGTCLGHPALGIFLVSALVVAALFWALRSVFSQLWSFVGAALAWTQFAPYSFYSCSYMGGGVSALGSCLLFGAAARLIHASHPQARHASLMGLSVFILAASRPFEGLLVCCGIGSALALHWAMAVPKLRRIWLTSVVFPGGAVLLAGAGLLMTYNHAVTGHALTLPYSVYESAHSRTPLFLWSKPTPRELPPTPQLEKFEMEFSEFAFHEEQAKSFAYRFAERFEILLDSFIPFWFPSTLLLLLSAGSSNRWAWFSWLVVLFFMLACSFTVWYSRHYLGCLLPFLCLIACAGARQLALFHRSGYPWGFQLFRFTLWSLFLLQFLLVIAAPTARARAESYALRRLNLDSQLRQLPGADLVLVRYTATASPHEEWVNNPSRIDDTPVIWAHSLSPEQNEALMRYFSHRRIWRLEVDEKAESPLQEITPQAHGQP